LTTLLQELGKRRDNLYSTTSWKRCNLFGFQPNELAADMCSGFKNPHSVEHREERYTSHPDEKVGMFSGRIGDGYI
jgi:hypothetical protein